MYCTKLVLSPWASRPNVPARAAVVVTASRVVFDVETLDHAPGNAPVSKPSEKPDVAEFTVSVALCAVPQLPRTSRRRTLTV